MYAINDKHLSNVLLAGILLVTSLCMAALKADWEQPKLNHNLTEIKTKVTAPAFTLMNLDDEMVSLKDFRGKVIMLNFWASWCPPCIREMPSMERLKQRVGNETFEVIAINQMEDYDHVFAFTGQLAVDPTFNILFDTDSAISKAYQVKGLPTTYLIDKNGNVRYRAVGGREFDHKNVVAIVQDLVSED